MAYYLDLSPCDYFGRWQGVLIAVGWLEQGHAFATGTVSKEFLAQLVGLLTDPWQPAVTAGFPMRFMPEYQRTKYDRYRNSQSVHPGHDGRYVAPSLITHYVDAHEYCPPADFQQAVLKCPEMKSFAYLQEMRARGLNHDAS